MAESSEFSTSNKYIIYKIYVSQNSQDIANNTSSQTVEVKFRRTNKWSGTPTHGSGTVYCTINGTDYTQSVSPSQAIPNNNSFVTLFSRTVTISHNNDGSKSIKVGARISLNTPLTSSYQDFNAPLPKIPRSAVFTGADDFSDEGNPRIWFNNPAGFKLQLKMEAGGNTHLIVRDNLYPSNPYTFSLTETERSSLRALCPNSNKLTVRFTVATYMPGESEPGNHSFDDRTMTIVNGNPQFSSNQLTYKDTNNSVVKITGNNQQIVRNQSVLETSFTAATARKYATISKYQISFNGVTQDKTSAGTYNLGTVDSSANLDLQIKVIDSRGNSTAISKTVSILDWVLPIINANAKRINNFENETNLKADVQISSVKNLNSIQTLQYRTKKVSDTAWGSWTDFQNNTETIIVLNNLFAWNLQVKTTDKFGALTQDLIVLKGMPILYFDTKKLSVGINCFPEKNESFEIGGKTIFDMIYPIGSIYYSINNVNPGTFFIGTTWVSVANTGDYKWRRTA